MYLFSRNICRKFLQKLIENKLSALISNCQTRRGARRPISSLRAAATVAAFALAVSCHAFHALRSPCFSSALSIGCMLLRRAPPEAARSSRRAGRSSPARGAAASPRSRRRSSSSATRFKFTPTSAHHSPIWRIFVIWSHCGL